MKDEIKRELIIFVQYVSLAFIANLLGFASYISSFAKEGAQINIELAWKGIGGYGTQIIIFFLVLSIIRLIIKTIYLYYKQKSLN